jgi:hypothetical protein
MYFRNADGIVEGYGRVEDSQTSPKKKFPVWAMIVAGTGGVLLLAMVGFLLYKGKFGKGASLSLKGKGRGKFGFQFY